jgi:hypothetical protein
MRVFVAYGYNDRDRWVQDLVFPFLEALGVEPLHGSGLYGQQIPPAVEGKIKEADAVVGFTSRRDPIPNVVDGWTTHPWVQQELVYGKGAGKRILECRERGVRVDDGILQGMQRVDFDATDRGPLLLELAKVVQAWKLARAGLRDVRMQILPPGLGPRLSQARGVGNLRCSYYLFDPETDMDKDQGPFPVTVRFDPGGPHVRIEGVPKDHLIRLEVQAGAELYTHSHVSPEVVQVTLDKQ